MTEAVDELADLVNEMYAAVVEECPLWELPRGATDLLPDGPVTHGPWEPNDCAELIAHWMDNGWVELYLPELPEGWKLRPAEWQARATRRGAFWILDEGDARQLLRETSRWDVEAVDGQVCLSRSDEGMTTDPRDWIAAATRAEASRVRPIGRHEYQREQQTE